MTRPVSISARAFATCALAVSLYASTLYAGEPSLESRARGLHRSASAHFDAGRYVEASADFSAGYELSHLPGFLWNMAECARLLSKNDRALELYRHYVAVAPDSSPQRAQAQQQIRALELSASRAPRFVIPVGGTGAASPAPAAAPASSAAPLSDEAALRHRHAAPAAKSVVFEAPRQQPPAKEGAKPVTSRRWFWTAAGAVAAAAIVTTAVVINMPDSHGAPSVPSGNSVVTWR